MKDKPVLLLAHGWGFDASFFAPLKEAMADWEFLDWDFGFTGAPARPLPPPDRPLVGIGHSFGLLWLLHEQPLVLDRLIAINGFSCFAARPDFPAGVSPRVIKRMQMRLKEDPAAVRREFLTRCGLDDQNDFDDKEASAETLSDALEALLCWDCRKDAHKVDLVLAGRSDPITPPEMTIACFPDAVVAWHDGGHLLAQEDPLWCKGILDQFLRKR